MDKGRGKRAQIELSFGFIFGIIVIVATIAVAFFVISYFLKLGRCFDTGLMYKDIEGEVNNAWAASGLTQKPFSEKAPSGVSAVCFGSFNGNPVADSKEAYDVLSIKYKNLDKNVFLYPSIKACNSGLASYKLEHIKVNRFFCAFVKNGRISITLNKTSTEQLVTIGK
ncbi:hypothetical protein J4217_00455 [Candidatus Pacearchaeota archaeon]|nr:hypothetical protein [Candidatus Pacearchaeota archaeon]